MSKLIWKIGWRAAILLIPTYLIWLTMVAPAPRAKAHLSEAVQTLQPFLETSPLQEKLRQLDLKDLKLADRTTIEKYYQDGKAAKDEATRDLQLTKKSLRLTSFALRDRDLYQGISSDIAGANKQLHSFVPIYQRMADLFSYYQASSLALYNFFYYDPTYDLKAYELTNNYKILQQSYGRAASGLQKTVSRLQTLPGYPDPTIKRFIPQITELADQAKQVSDMTSRDPAGAYILAQDFAAKISRLQQQLLQDRRSYWEGLAERGNLINDLRDVSKKSGRQMSVLVARLNQLKK